MQIVVVGISHSSAPVELRERLWVAPDALPDVIAELRASVAESFILSTCNRVELYAVCGHEATGAEMLRQFLASRGGLSLQEVREASYAYGHEAAVRHTLRVAAGLDSLMLGEDEILGQMRRAVDGARRARALGPVLDRLASAALACGKRVRTGTRLGKRQRSMASLALRAAARVRGTLAASHVVVVGGGETAALALAGLVETEGVRVTVVNRTLATAQALAEAHGAQARAWDELGSVLTDADVVVACTAAPTPVITAAEVEQARAASPGRPLVCIDLGVPRDIAPAVGALEGVTLLDVDRLRADADACRREVGDEQVRAAEAIVSEEAERYMEWWRGRSVAATISRLHARAAAVADAEVGRAIGRLPELSPRGREVVAELATRLVRKLLHEPSVTLKRDPEGANMALVVESLFALRGDEGAADVSCAHEPAATERPVDLHLLPKSITT